MGFVPQVSRGPPRAFFAFFTAWLLAHFCPGYALGVVMVHKGGPPWLVISVAISKPKRR